MTFSQRANDDDGDECTHTMCENIFQIYIRAYFFGTMIGAYAHFECVQIIIMCKTQYRNENTTHARVRKQGLKPTPVRSRNAGPVHDLHAQRSHMHAEKESVDRNTVLVCVRINRTTTSNITRTSTFLVRSYWSILCVFVWLLCASHSNASVFLCARIK